MSLFTELQLDFLGRMRVARLATAGPSGQPHVIPIVFAIEDDRLFTPIDEKPKTVAPHRLKRIRNLIANPQTAVVADHYEEDWTHLAWVLMTGMGAVLDGGPFHTRGIRLLETKYPQYETMRLEPRPLIVITIEHVKSWGV